MSNNFYKSFLINLIGINKYRSIKLWNYPTDVNKTPFGDIWEPVSEDATYMKVMPMDEIDNFLKNKNYDI